jgi:hypothetical protein
MREIRTSGCASSEGWRVQREKNPAGARVRGSVAWMAGRSESDDLKPIDKALFRRVSESPGRNESERTGGPERAKPRRPSPQPEGRRQHEPAQTDRSDGTLRRGGSDSTVTRTRRATGEALLVPPRNRRSQVGPITGGPGKWAEDERVAEGFVVARKRGNARGAKGPCCMQFLRQHGRQGRNDKAAHQSARPETEDRRQGEGREVP